MVKRNLVLLLVVSLSLAFLSTPLLAEEKTSSAKEKDQLVQAIDAAWVRVLASSKYREITKPVRHLLVNIADCLPNAKVTPFPENPTGVLKRILDTKEIKVGVMPSNPPGPDTAANMWTSPSEAILMAILDELGKAYGLSGPIKVTRVEYPPPFQFTDALKEGKIDIVDQVQALGGKSVGLRRRTHRRFTCTIFATGQYLHVRKDSPYKSMDDVLGAEGAKICAGVLSTQLGNAYFKKQTVETKWVRDMAECTQGVKDGTYDGYLFVDPNPVDPGLRTINTGIVAGTPYWVAGD
jgi:ABC-type amino acid transport substrate-binding protein